VLVASRKWWRGITLKVQTMKDHLIVHIYLGTSVQAIDESALALLELTFKYTVYTAIGKGTDCLCPSIRKT